MFNRQSIHIALLLWGSIFSLIAATCMYMSRNFDKEKRRWILCIQISSVVLLFSDAIAWMCRGGEGIKAAAFVRVSNFLVFLLSDLILFFFHGYVCSYLFPGENKKINWSSRKCGEMDKDGKTFLQKRICAAYLIPLFGAFMVIVSQFTNLYYYIDAQNYYHRNVAYPLSLLIPFVGMALDFTIIIQCRKKISKEIFISMLSYLLLPLMGTIILLFYYGISFVNIAISISVIFMFVSAIMEQNQKLAQKEKEAADMRISIMISQIQPHFMYNALNSIYYLCDKDTKLAKEAIHDFSQYLQYILRSMSRSTKISFREELKHIKAYLKLEKMRFEDDLNIVYQIETLDFSLPALSVQPLVENAVKHGICKKDDAGTLTLITRETENQIEIVIEDDGVGFSPQIKKNDGRPHIGIQNVKERLQAMCGGRLTIKSKIGVGTTVTITLPKEKS